MLISTAVDNGPSWRDIFAQARRTYCKLGRLLNIERPLIVPGIRTLAKPVLAYLASATVGCLSPLAQFHRIDNIARGEP